AARDRDAAGARRARFCPCRDRPAVGDSQPGRRGAARPQQQRAWRGRSRARYRIAPAYLACDLWRPYRRSFMGHLHGPATETADAPITVPFPLLASPIDGAATLSESQMADLLAGRWYVNIHTRA